jgi:hypothetical protein
MCLKCREEVTNPPTQVNFIDDCYNGIVFELSLFTTNIKKEVFGVLEFSFHFKEDMKKESLTKCKIDVRTFIFYFLSLAMK